MRDATRDRSAEVRMRLPAPALRPFVQVYWSLESTDRGAQRFLPGVDVAWLFAFADPGSVVFRSERRPQPHAMLKGVLSQASVLHPGARTSGIGVAFRPGGASVFHRVPLGAYAEGFEDLDACDDPALATLARRIRDSGAFDEVCDLLDRHLLRRLSDATDIGLGARLVGLLGTRDGLRTLYARGGYSSRQLRRLFDRHVGARPKLVSRILRLRRAAPLVARGDLALGDIGHQLGWFDQAHFTRDFRDLVGLSPTAYRQEERAFGGAFG